MQILKFFEELLQTPVIFIGLIALLGNILGKRGFNKTVISTFTTMVGLQMLLFSGSQFGDLISPIINAVVARFNIRGYLMGPEMFVLETMEELNKHNIYSYVTYVYLLAFGINLLMVFLGKFTKARGVFLCGSEGVFHSMALLWLVYSYFGGVLNIWGVIIVASIMLGIYWSLSTTLAIKPLEKITGGEGGFTIGHNETFAFWFYSKFAHLFGDPEKDDAENLKLPGFLSVLNNNLVAVAILMTIISGGFLCTLGWAGAAEVAGGNPIIYAFTVGVKFSVFMEIGLMGVRLMTSELTQAFQGIQERVAPNAVPALDVAAVLGYGPTSATLGFLFTLVGSLLAMLILLLTGSNVMVVPGFIPLFFAGGPIGILANKYGGWKAIIVCCISLGLIQSFGTIWAINLCNIPDLAGWSGMFDWSTFWPAVTEAMRAISKLVCP